MIDIRKSSLAASALLVGLFGSGASAQDFITARVPFAFVVNGKEFPAGQYSIRRVDDSGAVFTIASANGRTAAFALTMSLDGHDPIGEQPALVFTRHETQYRLSEIWESEDAGRALSKGSPKADRTASNATVNGDSRYVIAANWK